jgi:hypothetical protein
MMLRMLRPAIVFTHTGLTVHAAPSDGAWRGELLDSRGRVCDAFSYTRETFPGAVIGALGVPDLAFAVELAARMWLHTAAFEPDAARLAIAG